MKNLTSLPKEKAFFDTYAPLAASVALAGIFAQVVSAITEVGIIYTGTAQSLEPLGLGWLAYVVAVAVAAIATAVIEVGLRKTAPVAIDSILFKRWHGLHLPISIFVWLLFVVLLATSGILSFSNSSVIVEQFTPPPTEQTTTAADSAYQAATATHRADYTADSTTIAATYATRIQAATTAADARLKAADEQIRGIESKEARSGNSYASQKDKLRAARAELEAAKAGELAELEAAKANELAAARTAYKAATAQATADNRTATGEVKQANAAAADERAATVAGYGGGLGYFTAVCLLLFVVSVILERIHKKGAGIEESVLLEAYDFRPSALVEGIAAIRERINHTLHSRITRFADATPAAPKPPQPAAVYDLATALQNMRFTLQMDDDGDESERVVYLSAKEPKEDAPPPPEPPARIGFKQTTTAPPPPSPTTNSPTNVVRPLYATNHEPKTTNHEPRTDAPQATATTNHGEPATTGEAYQSPDLRHALQQLKKYKKRMGSHQQQGIVQERKDGKVCKRTADAIENNAQWVAHWERIVSQLKSGK